MPSELKDVETDFDTLPEPELRRKYKDLAARYKDLTAQFTSYKSKKSMEDIATAGALLELQSEVKKVKEFQDSQAASSISGLNHETILPSTIGMKPAASAVPTSTLHHSVVDLKELEKFRLGVWIVKAIVFLFGFTAVMFTALYFYAAYISQEVPDLSLMASVFGHLKEILIVIIESEK